MKRILVAVALTVVLGLGACDDGGVGTPAQVCARYVTTVCTRVLECLDPADYPPGVTDQASCEAFFEDLLANGDCSTVTEADLAMTCDPGQVFHLDTMDACSSDVAAASCADLTNGPGPASCQMVCQ